MIAPGPCTCGLPYADHLDRDPQRAAVLMALAGCDGYRITRAEAKTIPAPLRAVPPRPRQGEAPMAIQSATTQLLELAEAMRGPEWADDLAGPLVAAKNAGWDWPRTFLFAARLLADENASPRDLVLAIRSPLKPSPEHATPAVMADAIAEMRSALQGGES